MGLLYVLPARTFLSVAYHSRQLTRPIGKLSAKSSDRTQDKINNLEI